MVIMARCVYAGSKVQLLKNHLAITAARYKSGVRILFLHLVVVVVLVLAANCNCSGRLAVVLLLLAVTPGSSSTTAGGGVVRTTGYWLWLRWLLVLTSTSTPVLAVLLFLRGAKYCSSY